MATLEEQRRATADGMAASRAPTGQAQRQAGGQAMIERRTGKAVVEDINRLTRTQTQRRTPHPIEPVGALPASRGRGVYQAPTGTAGIASPLVEDPGTRQYHPARLITTSDGMLALMVRRVSSITFTDSAGAEVIMEFDDVPSV